MAQSVASLACVAIGAAVLLTACSPSAAEKVPSASTAATAAPPPVKCPQGSAKPMDMAKLAWLAEKADGKRNQDWRLVIDRKGEPQLLGPGDKDDDVSCDVNVKVVAGGTPRTRAVDSVRVYAHPDTTLMLKSDSDYDAVFWTQSSVEKFVWPYYHSHRLWNDTLEAIRKKFTENGKTFAVAHQAPSRSTVQGRDITNAMEELYIAKDTAGRVVWQPALEFVGLARKSR